MAHITRSRWRREADRVVAAALEALPPDATDKDRRAAVRAAFPFGERAMLPYRHWLAAVRAALGPSGPVKKEAPPDPRFVLHYLDGKPHLGVVCGWCAGRVAGGCLACLPLWVKLRQVVAAPDWVGFWRAAVAGDQPGLGLVRDWLLDRGIEVPL